MIKVEYGSYGIELKFCFFSYKYEEERINWKLGKGIYF